MHITISSPAGEDSPGLPQPSWILRQAGQAAPDELASFEQPENEAWMNGDGLQVHPDAPAGGGGTGFFHQAAPFGSGSDPWDSLPHPRSPAARDMDPLRLDEQADEPSNLAQPAPVILKQEKKKVGGIEVTIEPDTNSDPGVKSGAETSLVLDPGEIPGPEWDEKANTVKTILGQPVMTASIRTRYAKGSDPDNKSAYGRGTTGDDQAKGNTSLGFHESCHRQDDQDYLKTHSLPKFGGQVGMTKDEWEKAGDAYEKAVAEYGAAAKEYSGQTTDEVGNPTKSAWKSKP